MQNDAIEYRLGVGFNRVSSRTAQRGEGLERPGRFGLRPECASDC